MQSTDVSGARIAVVGLGHVDLHLAVEFGRQYATVGFEISAMRVGELRQGKNNTREVQPELLAQATHLSFTDQLVDIAICNVYIVTVPTPIDIAKRPDLTPLIKASEALGSILKPGDTVIYESTVYPGCTEEICVPILERISGLRFEANAGTAVVGADLAATAPRTTFAVGYSPERINPGDKAHRIAAVKKVTSGSPRTPPISWKSSTPASSLPAPSGPVPHLQHRPRAPGANAAFHPVARAGIRPKGDHENCSRCS